MQNIRVGRSQQIPYEIYSGTIRKSPTDISMHGTYKRELLKYKKALSRRRR
jgi:hypothetical protein